MKLHLGAGTCLKDGWTNADVWVPDCVKLFWNRLSREDELGEARVWVKPGQESDVANATKFVKLRSAQDLSAFEAGSCDEIYSAHWMEHFHPAVAYELFGEFQRLLKPGVGTMLHVVPDFDRLVYMWQAMHSEWDLEFPVQAWRTVEDNAQRRVKVDTYVNPSTLMQEKSDEEIRAESAKEKAEHQSRLVYDYERYNTIVNGTLCPFLFSSDYPQHKSLWGKHLATFLMKRWGFDDVKAEVVGTDLHFSAKSPTGIYNTIRL